MRNIKWQISGGFEQKDIEEIHKTALKIIEKIGILTPSERALRILKAEKGVKIKNSKRVCIFPERVEELLGPFPRKLKQNQPQEPEFYISGYSLRCYDFRTGEIRQPTVNDLVEFTKIAHMLGVKGSAMVMPLDIPQKLAEIATYKMCLDVSDRIFGAGVFSDEIVYDLVQEINVVIGNGYLVGMHMISSLSFDPFLLEMAMKYIPKKPFLSVGNMPMQGATCVIDIPGALAQSCAEVLGGATILKMLGPECQVEFLPFVYPFDMRYGTIVYGGPDFVLANLALNQIAQFYGTTAMAKAFNTMGKIPDDAQVGFSTAGCLAMMLTGMKRFGWAGCCCIDEIASVEVTIIQYEIFNAVKHIVKGFQFDTKSLNPDVVSECIKDSFLTHETTLKNYKNQFFESEIFSNETFRIWDLNGRKKLIEKAREKATKLLNSHSFERDKHQQKELDRIWEKAKNLFLS